jgi:hypothetical protein
LHQLALVETKLMGELARNWEVIKEIMVLHIPTSMLWTPNIICLIMMTTTFRFKK